MGSKSIDKGDEQGFRALMQSIGNFVLYWLVDDNSQPHLIRVISVSPSIKDIMGVSDPMKFETWLKVIHPDDRPGIIEAIIRVFQTGKFDEIFRIYHPQKEELRWMHAVSTSIRDNNGQDTQIIGLIVDITEQKSAETALMKSNDKLKSILETSPVLIFQLDLKGKVTYLSNLLEKQLDRSYEEMKGRFYHEFISPRMRQSSVEAFEKLISERSAMSLELEILKKNGKYRPYEVSAGPIIVNKNMIGLQGVIRDITAHKKWEAELEQYKDNLEAMLTVRTMECRESNVRYDRIVEDMPQMVCRFLPEGTITFANKACGKYSGGKPDKLVGRNFFQWISSKEKMEKAKKDFMSSIEKPYPLPPSTRMRLEDGSVRSVGWSGHGLFDDTGSLTECQAVGRDITRKRSKQKKKAISDKLLRHTQKLEAIGTLSSGIAHDFNNIIAVILGNVQLAMDDVSEGSRTRDNLDEIYEVCLRARNMVKQILTFSREGDQELRPLNLAPVIKESIKFLRSTIPSTIEIHENVHDTDLVNADPTQIGQIIMNLGTNAAHAMGSDPSTLDISLENITIDHNHKDYYRISDEAKYVKLTVRDTGCGISPRVISSIFNPYFTTKKEGEGTGMGLAVVHGIVEAHGGIIWADSEPGKGSTFHLLFPVTETEFINELDSPEPVLKGNERILLVDDEIALLKAEREMIERLGYEVTGTTSPVEALKIFRDHPDRFDLVYTDMTMPGMTGLTLAKKLMKIRPDLPVILYSGHGNLIDNDEIKISGVRAFLKKPILLKDLALTIRQVLENE